MLVYVNELFFSLKLEYQGENLINAILNGKEYDIQQLKGIQKKKITFDSEDTQYFYFKIVDKSVEIHII